MPIPPVIGQVDAPPLPVANSRPDAGWTPLGSLTSLYIRVGKAPTPRRVTSVQAIADFGLAGDKHASPQSPRQLLLAGRTAYAHWGLPPASLRENLLIDFSTERLASCDLLRVGNEVILWMTFLCEPCSLLERQCPGTLKAIGANRGMLARVVRGGALHEGDAIAVCRWKAPVFSNAWQDRVVHVACAVPEGFRISYGQLADMAGVHPSYCRAFPRVLSRLPAAVANRVGSDPKLPEAPVWSGAGLFESGVDFTSSDP